MMSLEQIQNSIASLNLYCAYIVYELYSREYVNHKNYTTKNVSHYRHYLLVCLIVISEGPSVWKDLHPTLNGLCLPERNNDGVDYYESLILRKQSENRAYRLR